jgi:phospholipase A1
VLPAGMLALCAAPAVAQDGAQQAAAQELEEPPPQQPRGFDFRPWKKNYFIASWDLRSEDSRPEAKFQVSLRSRLADWGPDGHQWSVDFGYTGLALWDAFSTDADDDAYFPADHSPEVFLETPVVGQHWLFRFSPFQHQSNGERGAQSRSWNRWYLEAIWHSHVDERTPRFFFDPEVGAGWRAGMKVWDGYSLARENADIEDYYGNFELHADVYSNSRARSVLTLAYRDSGLFGGESRHTLRVEYGFDLTEDVRFSLHWFSGYGDYLLRYDQQVQRIGFGIEIAP